uniref:ENTH domain-containing protein n=1 Tax=Macrostomum lignano TaxID=282301 RepID=A0A1I8JAK2_9PLAT
MATIKRNFKNIVHNYSDAQVKVREATSNDPWGPSSTLMSEISDMTNNVMAYTEIMSMIWKRLNDKNKNWRHVYKALVLLEYIIKTGSEKVAQQCKENLFAIQSLRDFQYTEEAKDHGLNVREKAKHLVALLKDDEKLKAERQSAIKAKERLRHGGGFSSEDRPPDRSRMEAQRRSESSAATTTGGAAAAQEAEDLQLQLALAISREEHEQELKRREAEGHKEEIKLKMALEASKKEDEVLSPLRMPPKQQQQEKLDNSTVAFTKEEDDNRKNKDSNHGATSELIDTAFSSGSDPWAAPVAPAASIATSGGVPSNGFDTSGDPWGGGAATAAPTASLADPWGGGGGGGLNQDAFSAAPPASGDPWAAAGAPLQQQQPAAPVDEFDLLGGRDQTGGAAGSTGPTAQDPWATDGSTAFAASGGGGFGGGTGGSQGDLLGGGGGWTMDQQQQQQQQASAAAQQPPRAKSAMDFLGEHGGLVNLDSLVTKPKGPSGPSNPFGGGGGSVFGNPAAPGRPNSSIANPFHQQQQAGPSLAELQQRQNSQATAGFQPGGSNEFGLPPPLIQAPAQHGVSAMTSYPAASNPWGSHQQQQPQPGSAAASFNPFL